MSQTSRIEAARIIREAGPNNIKLVELIEAALDNAFQEGIQYKKSIDLLNRITEKL